MSSGLLPPLVESPSTSDLSTIIEDDTNNNMTTSSKSINATLQELNIDPSTLSSTLSPTQIREITSAIFSHLQKHGKVTLDLINFIKDGLSSSTAPTSTTPNDRPTLMSSDKMSSTSASYHRYTIQQLSRYFGFRSLKNWDTLHDVCQPNFSLIHPTESS
jgi:hypothetical protein